VHAPSETYIGLSGPSGHLAEVFLTSLLPLKDIFQSVDNQKSSMLLKMFILSLTAVLVTHILL